MTVATDRCCGWNTGTVWTGPARCGKRAKATTDHPSTDNTFVCGIHARTATNGRFGQIGVAYTVTPL